MLEPDYPSDEMLAHVRAALTEEQERDQAHDHDWTPTHKLMTDYAIGVLTNLHDRGFVLVRTRTPLSTTAEQLSADVDRMLSELTVDELGVLRKRFGDTHPPIARELVRRSTAPPPKSAL